MKTEKLAVIGLVIIIAGVLSAYLIMTYGDEIFKNLTGSGETIEIGDCVDVHYTGSFENGIVFDTNLEDVAIEWDLYNETLKLNGYYELIKVFVDPNFEFYPPEGYDNYTANYVTGFLNGLVGMGEGETKNVTIEPEDAYGIWNITVMEETFEMYYGSKYMPRYTPQNLTETIQKQYFPFYVSDINLSELYVNQTFTYVNGTSQDGENVSWQIQIINMSGDNVTIKHLVENGTIVEDEWWNRTILVDNETSFRIREDPEINTTFGYPGQWLKVLDVNETGITMAMNLGAPDVKFVGQTLIFELEVLEVYKTSQQES